MRLNKSLIEKSLVTTAHAIKGGESTFKIQWFPCPICGNPLPCDGTPDECVECGLAIEDTREGKPMRQSTASLVGILVGFGLILTSGEAMATQPPAAPTGLAAVAVSRTEINLSWTAPTGGASYYNVLRGTTSGGPYTKVATPSGTSFSNLWLTSNTTYYYVVQAVNAGGTSPNSNQATATTFPNHPTGLTAVAVSQAQIN